MNSIFNLRWNRLPVLAGALLLAVSGTVAAAAANPRDEQRLAQQQARQERQAERSTQREERRAQPQQDRQQRQVQQQENREQRQALRQQRDEAQRQQREQARQAARESRPPDAQLRPGLAPRPDRQQGNRQQTDRNRDRNDPRFTNRNPSRQWSTNPGNRDRYHRPVPPRRYVPALPHGHTRYNWHGRPYYYYGGSWYRPWGSQFAIVRPPVGLYVSYLPSYHTSFYYGSSRYFFADDIYYLYEPARRGYVVARSPYDDDAREEDEATFDEDELYVYPAQGQSEQQQADDRYECHRWSVGETGYDPVEGNFDPGERAEYMRALSACLTGKGYTVR